MPRSFAVTFNALLSSSQARVIPIASAPRALGLPAGLRYLRLAGPRVPVRLFFFGLTFKDVSSNR